MQNQIELYDTKIRQDEQGRFCLNDLHRASGGKAIHAPSQFLRLKGTKDFVRVLDSHNANMHSALEIINGGINQGCYADEKIVYKYAAWISSEFEVKVYETFDKAVKGELPQKPTTLSRKDLALMVIQAEEENERLQLENKQQATHIAAMESYFRNGISPFEFVKGLNGVNALKVGAFLVEKNWLYQDGNHKRVKAYARDQYLTEETTEIAQHGKTPFVAHKPVLLKKGAAKLYEWYVKWLNGLNRANKFPRKPLRLKRKKENR